MERRVAAPAALEQRAQALEAGGADALRQWVRATMDGRLGSTFPAAGVEWWADYMASTRVDTALSSASNWVERCLSVMVVILLGFRSGPVSRSGR